MGLRAMNALGEQNPLVPTMGNVTAVEAIRAQENAPAMLAGMAQFATIACQYLLLRHLHL